MCGGLRLGRPLRVEHVILVCINHSLIKNRLGFYFPLATVLKFKGEPLVMSAEM